MGIFSSDEEPSWSDVIYLEEKVKVINDENENLKQLNKELTHYLACITEQRNRANSYLREIKTIAVRAIAKQQEYKKDFEQIIDIIDNADSEG